MRRFHVVVMTRDLTHTLTICTSGGWLLPWLDDNPHAELPQQLQTLLNSMVSGAEMVHEAPLLPAAARSDSLVQGYSIAVARGAAVSEAVRFVPNAELATTSAVLSLQRQAWSLAMTRLRAPVADFDSIARVDAAVTWAERQIAACSGGRVVSQTRHRCSRFEYVLRLDTTDGVMYFKGGRERVADEGVLTELLHALEPHGVPETLAIDVVSGRWLYRELHGELLIGPRLTLNAAIGVMPSLAGLQKRALAVVPVQQHLAARCLAAQDLFDTVDRTVETVLVREAERCQGDSVSGLLERWRCNRDAMFERCRSVDRMNLPHSLVLSDFWSRNVLVGSHGVGFIDLERCYWSLPFLSLWRFTHQVERTLQAGGVARAQIQSAFVSAWADIVPCSDMTRAIVEAPLLGRLFAMLLASRELDLQARDLGSPLPFGYRGDVLSRHVRQLLESVFGTECVRLPRASELNQPASGTLLER